MAINQLSVGRQLSLTVVTQFGELNIDTVTDVTWSATPEVRKSILINGNIIFAPIPSGGRGEIMFQRTSPEIEQYWSAYEAAYYAGQNLTSNTLVFSISEANGALTQYVLTGVMFDAPEFGRWSGNEIISQRLSFSYSKAEEQV